jgi:predicted porin
MKKSLIALAVAGLVSAPAFAATSNVDVYGIMSIAIQDTDVSGVDLDVVDNSSRIGFKGSEDLGGGLKAVWQIEHAINATGTGGVNEGANGAAFGGSGMRNTFVGLAGGFGTALIGRHDTPYKIATGKYDIFADTIGDYNTGRVDGVALINGTHDARGSNAIAYISPNFSGLTIAAAVVTSNDALTINGAGSSLNVGESVDVVSIAAMYANGPLTVDFAYQDVDNYSDAWKVGVGYTFGDVTVGAVYEDSDDAQKQEGWLLNAKYAMGPIALKAMYGQVDVGAADGDLWVLGADYALSKRTTAYVVYANGDNDVSDDVSGWNIGVKHSF